MDLLQHIVLVPKNESQVVYNIMRRMYREANIGNVQERGKGKM